MKKVDEVNAVVLVHEFLSVIFKRGLNKPVNNIAKFSMGMKVPYSTTVVKACFIKGAIVYKDNNRKSGVVWNKEKGFPLDLSLAKEIFTMARNLQKTSNKQYNEAKRYGKASVKKRQQMSDSAGVNQGADKADVGGLVNKTTCRTDLSEYTPRELILELRRRGYKGTLTFTNEIVL